MRPYFFVLAFASIVLLGCSSSNLGHAYVREAGGGIGAPIPGVTITFIKEDRSAVYTATTDASGSYSIDLPQARYVFLADHPDYEDYSSAPGFTVINSNQPQTLNVFLREPRVTTILLVRHAEKQNPNSNDQAEPLSADGEARARELAESIYRSGVTEIYSTNFVRTLATAQPLADSLKLQPILYDDPAQLASQILADHTGDIVFVVGHSNTAGAVANALGANVPTQTIGDYDNLYVITVAAQTNVVNLQYGADSTPDLEKNESVMPTLLLVQNTTTGGQSLAHVAEKADVAAIYSAAADATVQGLAAELGLPIYLFDVNDVAASVAQILADHGNSVVVLAGSNEVLRAALDAVGGYPIPAMFGSEDDNIFVVTPHGADEARLLNLRY
ncbi:MAG: histidine phosphatase family protein [Bacteroidetes bacterium]|nr:histidine phosphatase family protein [Bacteroidota bacterium]